MAKKNTKITPEKATENKELKVVPPPAGGYSYLLGKFSGAKITSLGNILIK